MKKNLMLAAIGTTALLSGCVAVPVAYEPTYAPPPAVVVAPPVVTVQPYLYAHWGHYYRGPYWRHRYRGSARGLLRRQLGRLLQQVGELALPEPRHAGGA